MAERVRHTGRSERRHHLAGALGAAIAERFLELDWLKRVPDSRALRVTRRGAQRLGALGLVLSPG